MVENKIEVNGQRAAENNGFTAIADGNAVKVVDNESIAIWVHPYILTLRDSNITDAVELSERNKLLWK